MKLRNWQIAVILFSLLIGLQNLFAYEKQADGVLFKLHKQKDTDAKWIKIQVCNDDIIRVIASPVDSLSHRPSLMVVKKNWKPVKWMVNENGSTVEISTSNVVVHVDTITGAVAFYDSANNLLLQENNAGGKVITSADVMGEQTYHIQEMFNSPEDETFYGLGQHQNGIMNYKGHDVDLWQYNIVDVIPFLVSNKHYGILWDNNSHTKFGDTRDYESLTNLKLYDDDGNLGGLTAEYFKDTLLTTLFTKRTEPRIDYEFIDVHDSLPDGFKQNVKAVRWSGEIECNEPGVHKFRLYSSSYTKMWLDGKLLVNSWRQNWLPWTHLLKLDMEKGKKYNIKIEWIPDDGYMGLKFLPPTNRRF